MTRNVEVDKNPMVVNPILLFSRLAAIAGSEDSVEKYFDFELTHRPRALFKDKLMGKPDKTSLCNIFFTTESMLSQANQTEYVR